MCDAALQNYSNFINNQTDETTDNIPTIMFYAQKFCTSFTFPLDPMTGNFTNFNYPINTRYELKFPPQAFYIPFNIRQVIFYGNNGLISSTFFGPFLVSDTSLINWEGQNFNMTISPITSIQIVEVREWDEQVVNMCMGQIHTIGTNNLSRYLPAGQRCDYFMQQQYCVNNPNDPICGCFSDLVIVKAMSSNLGVDLPVLCFGESCATKRTYKTNSIKNKPCNMTICQQALQLSANVSGTTNSKVFCGGHFYDNVTPLVAVSVSPIPNITNTNPPTESPWFVYVILAVSIVLFALLAFLMFSETKNTNPNKLGKQK